MSTVDDSQTGEEHPRHGSPGDGTSLTTATIAPHADLPAGVHGVQQLADQLAEAECQKGLARLDLEWEIERRQFLIVTNRTPSGEIPKHSTAIAFLAVGVAFALGMALAILASAVGFFLLLLFGPIIALTVFIIWSGVDHYFRARGYQNALARYESRCNAVRLTPAEPAVMNGGPAPGPADPLATLRLAERVAEARYQAELARLDKEWEIERQKHYITARGGGRFLPDRQQARGTAIGGVVFGVVMVLTNTPAFFP